MRLGVGGPHIKKASGKVATVQLADEQMMSFLGGLYIFWVAGKRLQGADIIHVCIKWLVEDKNECENQTYLRRL